MWKKYWIRQAQQGSYIYIVSKDIAFSSDGMWAETDDTNHCVWIFNNEDQLVRKFGSKGTDNGKFNHPLTNRSI